MKFASLAIRYKIVSILSFKQLYVIFWSGMKKNHVLGTKGYPEVLLKFIEATTAIDFTELHKDFLQFIPKQKSRILDFGAGIGRDAAVLTNMGHLVTAVEPTEEFRAVGKSLYGAQSINWIDDSLPELLSLENQNNHFDFILASGVWHHLDHSEQYYSMLRISKLLSLNGIFALTLRHGPAGVGKHVFSIDSDQTIRNAKSCGLKTLVAVKNQPSLMKNKEKVSWTKLVFQNLEM